MITADTGGGNHANHVEKSEGLSGAVWLIPPRQFCWRLDPWAHVSLPLQFQGTFDLQGNFPEVPPNVRLWKGLFSDSLPAFLDEMDRNSSSGRAPDVTYLHVDCDLYGGVRLPRGPGCAAPMRTWL